MELKENNTRVLWVDILKGLLILLVILGHVTSNVHIKNYISTFYMPCFFILSGWFMKKNGNVCTFVKKRIKSILFPYIFFSLIWIAFSFLKKFIIESDFDIFKALISILLPYSKRATHRIQILYAQQDLAPL